MRRRIALGLFAALAVLVAPGSATAAVHASATEAHSSERLSAADRHATTVHIVAPARRGHERRAPQSTGLWVALLGAAIAVALAGAWSRRAGSQHALVARFLSSSRSRAPPAVV